MLAINDQTFREVVHQLEKSQKTEAITLSADGTNFSLEKEAGDVSYASTVC